MVGRRGQDEADGRQSTVGGVDVELFLRRQPGVECGVRPEAVHGEYGRPVEQRRGNDLRLEVIPLQDAIAFDSFYAADIELPGQAGGLQLIEDRRYAGSTKVCQRALSTQRDTR